MTCWRRFATFFPRTTIGGTATAVQATAAARARGSGPTTHHVARSRRGAGVGASQSVVLVNSERDSPERQFRCPSSADQTTHAVLRLTAPFLGSRCRTRPSGCPHEEVWSPSSTFSGRLLQGLLNGWMQRRVSHPLLVGRPAGTRLSALRHLTVRYDGRGPDQHAGHDGAVLPYLPRWIACPGRPRRGFLFVLLPTPVASLLSRRCPINEKHE